MRLAAAESHSLEAFVLWETQAPGPQSACSRVEAQQTPRVQRRYRLVSFLSPPALTELEEPQALPRFLHPGAQVPALKALIRLGWGWLWELSLLAAKPML